MVTNRGVLLGTSPIIIKPAKRCTTVEQNKGQGTNKFEISACCTVKGTHSGQTEDLGTCVIHSRDFPSSSTDDKLPSLPVREGNPKAVKCANYM